MAAGLPAGAAGLTEVGELPGIRSRFARHDERPDWDVPRRAGRHVLADLRAGRAFLAGELSQSGWLDFGAFNWRDIAVGRAARATIGVITPLAIGIATDRVEFGSFAALGALPAGFVSFRGVTRTRVVAVTLTALGMAISTFVGAAASAHAPWLLVPIIFIWAYVAGLLGALGPTALTVALQWPVALLIGSALPLSLEDAAVRAGLVLAGGLWQSLLVITSWALAGDSAERAALAANFVALADYAADLAAGRQEPPNPGTFSARTVIGDPNPLLRTEARLLLLDLNEEGDRIRTTLTAAGIGRPPDDADADASPGLLATAQRALTEIAAGLTGRDARRAGHLNAARALLAQAEAEPGTRWEWAGEALLGQLRAAARLTGRLNDVEPIGLRRSPEREDRGARGPRTREIPPVRQSTVKDMATTLRASLGTSSETGRHALRLAVVTASGEAIIRAAGLSHGYWGVLTIFIVLRPDYSSTLYRGLQRAAGTVIGAGLGFLTVQLVHVGLTVLLWGIALSLLAAYAVFTVNYLLYAVFLTDFVVILLALLGLPAGTTALARLIGTGVGTGLALLGYILWPTWESTSASEKFGRLYAAQGSYAAALLRAYTRSGENRRGRRPELRLAARRARIDADASADRLAGEPNRPPMTADLARALATTAHRISQACITLNAAVDVHHDSPASTADVSLRPHLDRLADDVGDAANMIAVSIRELGADGEHRRVPQLPPLRADQRALQLAATSPGEAAGLFAATDALVDAIDTAAYVFNAGE